MIIALTTNDVCSFRAHVTPRFVRHFNVIGYVDMSDDDKRVIFSTILDNFLSTGFETTLARCQKKRGGQKCAKTMFVQRQWPDKQALYDAA